MNDMLSKIIHLCCKKNVMRSIQLVICASIIWFAPGIVQALQTGVVIQHNGANLGRVSEGPVIIHTFVLWNISFHDIKIRGVAPGCDCSVAQATDQTIPPLRHSSVTMAIKTAGIGDGEIVKVMRIDLGDKRELMGYVKFYIPSTDRNTSRSAIH